MRIVRPLIVTAVAAAALLGAPSARAEEAPDEPVRYPPSSVRPKLVVGGLLVAGIGYGGALLGSEAAPNWPGADVLKVPVLGPWLTVAQNGCPRRTDIDLATGVPTYAYEKCEAWQYLRLGLLIVDGLMQAAGIAIVAEAILMKTEAGAAPKKPATGLQLGGVTLHPAPIVSPTMGGVGFVGTF